MKVLKAGENRLTALGIFSHRLKESTSEFLKSINAYVVVFSLLLGIGVSAIFIQKNYSDKSKFSDIVLACFQILASLGDLGSVLAIGANMIKLKLFHTELQQTVDDAEKTAAFEIYRKIERFSRMIIKYGTVLILFVMATVFFPSVVHASFCMWHGNFDMNSWLLLLKIDIPYNVLPNNLRWLILLSIGFVVVFVNASVMVIIMAYFISCCSYIEGCCDHFQLKIRTANENIDRAKKLKEKIVPKNCAKRKKLEEVKILSEVKTTLDEAILFHDKITNIINLLAEATSGALFSVFFTHLLCLVTGIFHLFTNLGDDKFYLCFNLSMVGFAFMCTFCFCYFADRVSSKVSAFGHIAYDTAWYQWPQQFNRHILLIILRSETPVRFTGFKIVFINLGTFTKFVKTAYSYYLALKDLSSC